MTYVAYGFDSLKIYVEAETKPEVHRKLLERHVGNAEKIYDEPIVVAKVGGV